MSKTVKFTCTNRKCRLEYNVSKSQEHIERLHTCFDCKSVAVKNIDQKVVFIHPKKRRF